MKLPLPALFVLLSLSFAACAPEAEPSQPSAPADATPTPAVLAMRGAIASLQQSPEHRDEEIEVQHILIAFKGAERATVTRSKVEAETLAAELFERAKSGEDFTALMKEYSTDPGPGIYPMTLQSRSGMVAGFGDVGWRLQPGMIGVAPYDNAKSPFGWHIIKRLK